MSKGYGTYGYPCMGPLNIILYLVRTSVIHNQSVLLTASSFTNCLLHILILGDFEKWQLGIDKSFRVLKLVCMKQRPVT